MGETRNVKTKHTSKFNWNIQTYTVNNRERFLFRKTRSLCKAFTLPKMIHDYKQELLLYDSDESIYLREALKIFSNTYLTN